MGISQTSPALGDGGTTHVVALAFSAAGASAPEERAWKLLAAAGFLLSTLVGVVLLPSGFQAFDDGKYLVAAERLLAEGPYATEDHWSARLPYILVLAAGKRLFGPGEAGLAVPQFMLAALVAVTAWRFGRPAFGPRVAALGVLLLAWTPMGLRLASDYVTEPMEMAFAGLSCVLVLDNWGAAGRRRSLALLAAGVLGGIALVIRQTAVAVPAALAILLLFADDGRPMTARWRAVLILALGHALPVLADFAYNGTVTGDPLHRLAVDLRHTEIPSEDLVGGTFPGGGGVLFNWTLVGRWKLPLLVDVHWTVNPLIRLLTDYRLLGLPALTLFGGVLVLRRGAVAEGAAAPLPDAARRLAWLALLLVGLQYVLNTYVLCIAPVVRYYWVATVPAAPLAAYGLGRLLACGWAPWAAAVAVFALPAAAAASLQASMSAVWPAVRQLSAAAPPLYLTATLREAMRLHVAVEPALAARLRPEPAPADSLLAGHHAAPPLGGWNATCANGARRYLPVARLSPGSLPWTVLQASGLERAVPPSLARVAQRESSALIIVRVAC